MNRAQTETFVANYGHASEGLALDELALCLFCRLSSFSRICVATFM